LREPIDLVENETTVNLNLVLLNSSGGKIKDHKEYNLRSAYLLKGTKIGIAEQFPKEIAEARKKLCQIMKKAETDGNTIKLI